MVDEIRQPHGELRNKGHQQQDQDQVVGQVGRLGGNGLGRGIGDADFQPLHICRGAGIFFRGDVTLAVIGGGNDFVARSFFIAVSVDWYLLADAVADGSSS